MRYRIEAKHVLTMDGTGTIHSPGQVTWEDNRLVSVGPLDNLDPVDQLIRIPQGIVLPGLYNGHNHAAMALMRGYADDSPFFEWLEQKIWPIESRLTADDIYIGTLLACAEMIRTGTVGFADMYFEVDSVARAVKDSGMRGWISRGLIGYQDENRERLEDTKRFHSQWVNQADGRIVPMLGPHAPYTCPPDYLESVARVSQDTGMGVHIHLAESRDEVKRMKSQYGKSPIHLAFDAGLFSSRLLIAHGVQVEADDLPLLRGMTGGIVSCPVSNAKLGNGILPASMLISEGVPLGLGTDGAASTNTLDMFEEMKAMAWMQKVRTHDPHLFKAGDALSMATKGSAAILGIEGGILQAGKVADFIVLDGNQPHLVPDFDLISNVVYSATGKDVSYTVVNGQILMAEGIIAAFDEQSVIEEARARAHSLVKG